MSRCPTQRPRGCRRRLSGRSSYCPTRQGCVSALSGRCGDELAAVVMDRSLRCRGHHARPRVPGGSTERTARRGIVLIFDEILSGYRTGLSGAQGYLGVTPDLSTFGKALGGGLPLSVFGGWRDLMSVVSPAGPAVHTGTYNANLTAILAAHAFLDAVAEPGLYDRLLQLSARLRAGLRQAFADARLAVRVQLSARDLRSIPACTRTKRSPATARQRGAMLACCWRSAGKCIDAVCTSLQCGTTG